MYQEITFENYRTTPALPRECPNEAALQRTHCENVNLKHTLALLWSYLIGEDIWDEAWSYIQEHSEEATPFDIIGSPYGSSS